MPRRNVQQAIKVAREEWQTKIRFLVRNPDFRRDLIEVRRRHTTDPRWETYFGFLNTWGLQWFPSELIRQGELPATPEEYETAIFRAIEEYGLGSPEREEDKLILLPPVVATEPYNEYVRANYDPADEEPLQVPNHIPRPGTILNLRVDLSYPQDVLEAVIEGELKQAKNGRKELQKLGVLPSTPQRKHLAKIDFYLRVFDRAAGGEPYRTIARALGSHKSTVQCAHLKAISLIGGARPIRRPPQRGRSRAPQRYSEDEYIRRHFRGCQTCRESENITGYCRGFRSWMDTNVGLPFTPFEDSHSEQTQGADSEDE